MPPGVGYGPGPVSSLERLNQQGMLAPLAARGNLLAAAHAPEAAPPGRLQRMGGILSQLFAGPDDPNLTPEQNERARNQALMQAGIAGLQASGPSPVPVGFGQVLAQMAGTGQQVAAGERAQAAEAEQRQQMMAALDGELDADQIRRLMLQRVIEGDPQGAQALSSVLSSLSGEEARGITIDVGDSIQLVNPFTGEQIGAYAKNLPEEEQELEKTDLGDVVLFHPRGRPDMVVYQYQKGITPEAQAQQVFQRGQSVFQNYLVETAGYRDIADAFDQFQGTIGTTGRGDIPSDVAALQAVIRVFNPRARMPRQGEALDVEQAGGMPDALVALINRTLLGGERITPTTRIQLAQAVNRVMESQRRRARVIGDQYRTRALREGLNPEGLIMDPFERLEPVDTSGWNPSVTGNRGDALDAFMNPPQSGGGITWPFGERR